MDRKATRCNLELVPQPKAKWEGLKADGDVIVDSISNEGNKTILVSMPAENGESTVIWLVDEEDEDEAPVDGEDPI